MLLKLLLPLIISPFAWVLNGSYYSVNLTVENHVLTEVVDKAAPEVRIYKEKEVTTIGEHAFDDCTFTSIMISTTVRECLATFPENIIVNYTGSLEDIAFDLTDDITVNDYACDEGFLNYWSEFIRPNIGDSICDVEKVNYLKMKKLYNTLSEYDRNKVDNVKDGTDDIATSIAFLDKFFSSSQSKEVKEKEISQSTMLTFILIVASFGMTSIGVFYILKDKNVIN